MTILDKLVKIKHENEKILRELQEISTGKRLTVGHHKVHPNASRPKTLHLDKLKKEAERIDSDNGKILDAILNAKPLIPITSDRRNASVQERLLKNISKSNKGSFAPILKRRKELIEYKKHLFPSILEYSSKQSKDPDNFQSHLNSSVITDNSKRTNSVSPRNKNNAKKSVVITKF